MRNNRTPANLNFLAMGVSAFALAFTPAVSAQENSGNDKNFVLEEIIITAQKRVQSLQDVALSVNVMSGEQMKNAGIDDFDEIAEYIPNFYKADSSIGSFLSIRGISSGLNNGFEQSVVIYSDEISLGRSPLSRAPFLDLARVEVVRGPQNVLNGKNSIGGALNLTTADPTQETEGDVNFEYDINNNGYDGTFMLSGGLSEKVMARFAGRYFQEDGYFTNNINGNKEASRKEVTLRGTVKIDFTDTMTARLKYEHNEWDYNGRNDEMIFGYEAPAGGLFAGLKYYEAMAALSGMVGQNIGTDDGMQNFARNTNFPETSRNTSDIVSLQVNWEIGGNALTATSGWAKYRTDEKLDVDGSGFDVLGISNQREDYEQFSQDIRITSPGGEKLDWIVGAFYQQWDLGFNSTNVFDDENLFSALGALGTALGGAIPPLAPLAALNSLADFSNVRDFTGDSKTWALYGQATYSVSDTVRLTLGARYTVEKKTGQRSMNIIDDATGTLDVAQGLTANAVFGIDYQNLGEFCAAIPIAPCFDANGNIKAIHDLNGSRKENSFTPTVIIEWDATDDNMVYASYSKGFKAGGFDARGNLASNFQFAEEKVNNFEIGMKSRLLDGAATFNLTGLY